MHFLLIQIEFCLSCVNHLFHALYCVWFLQTLCNESLPYFLCNIPKGLVTIRVLVIAYITQINLIHIWCETKLMPKQHYYNLISKTNCNNLLKKDTCIGQWFMWRHNSISKTIWKNKVRLIDMHSDIVSDLCF